MNPLIHSKNTTILPVLIALTLTCFGLLPQARAIDPPPDGGYPFETTIAVTTTSPWVTLLEAISLRAVTISTSATLVWLASRASSVSGRKEPTPPLISRGLTRHRLFMAQP